MDISIKIECKFLEDFFMNTREELITKISDLATTVKSEAEQVRGAVSDLAAIVEGLKAKVAGLEGELTVAGDFTAEMASLEAVSASIAEIYSPSPVVAPEVSPA